MIGLFVPPAPNQGWSYHALRSSPATPAADGANPMARQLTVGDVSFVRNDYANQTICQKGVHTKLHAFIPDTIRQVLETRKNSVHPFFILFDYRLIEA